MTADLGSGLYERAVEARLARRLDEAERLFRQVLAAGAAPPAAAFELGMVLLAQGRLREGWPLYDERPIRVRVVGQNLNIPEWRGEDLTGKRLLIWREQGYGDQILMARFLPMLGAASVTYAGPPALGRLFGQLGVNFVSTDSSVSTAGHDYWVMPMSIPSRLGIDELNLPRAPYLQAAARPGAGRFGVKVAGEPSQPNDRFRSLPPDLAAELLALPGAVDLDPDVSGARDLLDTAEIIAGLDFVISVDTGVAHLAGALGKPLWVLLSAGGMDWQWPRHAPALWYPSARPFVQPVIGDWRSVLGEVRRAVGERATSVG